MQDFPPELNTSKYNPGEAAPEEEPKEEKKEEKKWNLEIDHLVN